MSLSRHRLGVFLCLLSAVAFGGLAILANLAYDEGVNLLSLLALRFLLAASALWALVALLRLPVRAVRRSLGAGALFGLVGYSAQAGLFFSALERIDAGLASLLLYAYPAFVTLGAIALGRERADRRRWIALGVATLGVALVLGGDGGGADLLGIGLAVASGVAYSIYILASDALMRGAHPLAFAASVCTGATATFWVVALASGDLDLGVSAAGWGWTAALALVSTVVAIAAFFGGVERVGPSRASILSTLEPATTVLLAFLVFGETLGWLQVLGGALVLCAAILVGRKVDPEPPGEALAARVDGRPVQAGV